MTFERFFDFGEITWLAVIVATATVIALGWVWFGPLFGKQWEAATGMKMPEGVPDTNKLVPMVIYSLIFNIGINYTSAGPEEFEHAVTAGGLTLGLLLIAMVLYSSVVWGRENSKAFTLNAGFWIVAATAATWVQGLIID